MLIRGILIRPERVVVVLPELLIKAAHNVLWRDHRSIVLRKLCSNTEKMLRLSSLSASMVVARAGRRGIVILRLEVPTQLLVNNDQVCLRFLACCLAVDVRQLKQSIPIHFWLRNVTLYVIVRQERTSRGRRLAPILVGIPAKGPQFLSMIIIFICLNVLR